MGATGYHDRPCHSLLSSRCVHFDLLDQPHLSRAHLQGAVVFFAASPLSQKDPRLEEVGMDGVQHESDQRLVGVVPVVEAGATKPVPTMPPAVRVPFADFPLATICGSQVLVGQFDTEARHG